MMIRPLAIALLMLVPSALAAQTPQTGQGRLEIVGQAPSACVIQGPGTAVATNATYASTGPSSGQLRIVEMVDRLPPSEGQSHGATADLALTVVCNSPHRLVVRSENGGMRLNGPSGAPQPFFGTVLPYQFRVGWLGQNASAESNGGGPLVMQSNQGGAGQLSLGVVLPKGVRLGFGDYRDAVILEFRAAD
jgi:hypothetical protein